MAYEISLGLVGSEVCIRDSLPVVYYFVCLAISFMALVLFASSLESVDKFSVDGRTLCGTFYLSSRTSRSVVSVVFIQGFGFVCPIVVRKT